MRSDWVNVKLTEAGEQLAGTGELVIVCGHFQGRFRAGESVRVTTAYDWKVVLSREQRNGQPLFCLAEKENA